MKKILLSLFGIITLGLINFGFCLDYINPGDIFNISNPSSYVAGTDMIICADGGGGTFNYKGYTVNFNGFPSTCIIVSLNDTVNINTFGDVDIYGYYLYCPSCFQCENDLLILSGNYNNCNNSLNSCQYDLSVCQNSTGSSDCLETESLLQSCNNDLGICQSNLSSCLGGGLSGENWSAIFINNLQFPGKPLINISIPDYITWDYTGDDEFFNVYVGSGYDVNYIESIIDINSYRPTSEDFTDVFVSGLTLIMPYIVIVLFIIFIWKLLKRIFN